MILLVVAVRGLSAGFVLEPALSLALSKLSSRAACSASPVIYSTTMIDDEEDESSTQYRSSEGYKWEKFHRTWELPAEDELGLRAEVDSKRRKR